MAPSLSLSRALSTVLLAAGLAAVSTSVLGRGSDRPVVAKLTGLEAGATHMDVFDVEIVHSRGTTPTEVQVLVTGVVQPD